MTPADRRFGVSVIVIVSTYVKWFRKVKNKADVKANIYKHDVFCLQGKRIPQYQCFSTIIINELL